MKHNYAKKWTVSELSAIQKRCFFGAIFAHFMPKADILLPDNLYWIADN